MSELRRWSEDEPPAEVRRLLEVGQWARPSGAVLEQTLLRVRAGAVADPSDAAVPLDHSAVRAGIKWSVVGALLLGSIGALTFGMRPDESASSALEPQRSESSTPPNTRVEAAPEPSAPAEPASATASEAPSNPASVAPASAKPAPQKPRGVAAPVREAQGASHTKICKPGVVEQINMLEQAKQLIQRGRGAEALAILDRYDRFGAGRCFVPESLKHRMDAYAQTGNASGAAQTATAIKKQYPDTAQARSADAVLKQK